MMKPPRHRNLPNNNNSYHNHAVHHQPSTTAHANAPISHPRSPASARTSSNSSTGSAPSSVMCVMPASPLTRELSDLSGSYMNGNTNPRGSGRAAHSSVCSTEDSVQGFWRQAHVLSVPCPRETSLPASNTAPLSAGSATPAAALIVVERNGVIELVKKNDTEGSSNDDHGDGDGDPDSSIMTTKKSNHRDASSSSQEVVNGANSRYNVNVDSIDDMFVLSDASILPQHKMNLMIEDDEPSSSRIPIIVLLLDPGRKQYELMQLWVDPETDLVRDVLLTLQRKLSDKWRQDYDGLFQLRGDKFCQLVHILSIAKYDVRPRELWVAKPWSMAAKSATDVAADCIRQLRAGGLLAVYNANSSGKSRIKSFFSKGSSGRTSPVFEADAPLTLSEDALKRLYVPGGILKHHHACQFLSFRSPTIPVGVMGRPHHQQHFYANSSNRTGFLGSLLGTSNFDDASSQLSNPSDAMLLPSSAASPSRKRHHRYNTSRYHPNYSLDSSGWKPTGPLESVGEVIVRANNDTSGQSNATLSKILAELDSPSTMSEMNLQEIKQEKRSSILQILEPLNCCRKTRNDKGDEVFSASMGGARRGGGRNKSKSFGRETPTSKGSGDGELDDTFLAQNKNSWTGAKYPEDGSIVSESVPLLNLLGSTSSTCSLSTRQPPEHHQPLHQMQPTLLRPEPFSRRGRF